MPKNLSPEVVAWILKQIGITLKRRGKEDVYTGEYEGRNRVVIVPRNKSAIPQGIRLSILLSKDAKVSFRRREESVSSVN